MLPELTEASYLSRFFAKFVEIVAGGLATVLCAYLISYLGVPMSPTAPVPAAVSAAPTAGASPPAEPAPPVAAVVVDEQRRASQPVAETPPAQPVRKAEKAAVAAPAPKDGKTGTIAARGEKSAEALARAALANFDAERPADTGRPAPADAPIRRGPTGTGSAPAAPVEVQQRPADVPPRQADIQQPPAVVDAQSRPLAAVGPLPPNSGSPPEVTTPQPERPVVEVKGLFSFLKRMPDLIRPGLPSLAAEAPRPPMPVGTASEKDGE